MSEIISNMKTGFSKYGLFVTPPIIYDLVVSKLLQKGIIEYDLGFLLVYLIGLIVLTFFTAQNMIKNKQNKATLLGGFLVLSYLIFHFSTIFGHSLSFTELLNL